jgi:phage-related protein
MSYPTYIVPARQKDKDLVWLRGLITTPPFSSEARRETGALLRQLQQGFLLTLPQSRPMPSIGAGCHELRVTDQHGIWRIIYRIEADAIVILDVFSKKTQATPKPVLERCRTRLANYLEVIR